MPHDQGILTGLDRATDEPKLVSQVISGKACNCYCAEGGSGLVAKKGKVREHHFSHAVLPPDMRPCQETALHLSAKTIAANVIHHLYIPERAVHAFSTLKDSKKGRHEVFKHEILIRGASNSERLSGSVEPLVPEISPYRPDARVNTAIGSFYIEIKVTHAVPPEKQLAMQEANLAVLELDFSKESRTGLTVEKLRDLVTFDAPRTWVSFGCNSELAEANRRLDIEVQQSKGPEEGDLMSRLGEELNQPLPETLLVHHIQGKLHGQRMPYFRYLPVTNVRRTKGFTMADLPGIPDVLVTSVGDEHSINRLFVWYESVKKRPLTVLSLASSTAIFTSSVSIYNHLLRVGLQ